VFFATHGARLGLRSRLEFVHNIGNRFRGFLILTNRFLLLVYLGIYTNAKVIAAMTTLKCRYLAFRPFHRSGTTGYRVASHIRVSRLDLVTRGLSRPQILFQSQPVSTLLEAPADLEICILKGPRIGTCGVSRGISEWMILDGCFTYR
jgi:hypothetical protein